MGNVNYNRTQCIGQWTVGSPALIDTAPASPTQRTLLKRGSKDCQSQKTRKAAVKISPSNDHTNKIGTIGTIGM